MNAVQCHRARMSFELYLDGGLSQEECEVLEAHLFECAACAAAVGDDVRLGEAIEEAIRTGGTESVRRPASSFRWAAPIRVAAAALLLLVAGICVGRITASSGGTPSVAPARPDSVAKPDDSRGVAELVPLTEISEDPWASLASFTDKDLAQAERDSLQSRTERFESRARRAEAAFDLIQPILEETATPTRIVARLSERFRTAAVASRSPKDDVQKPREPGREPIRQGFGAELLRRCDPHAAFSAVTDWIRAAQSPAERRAAVRLLALLRVSEAHDVLAAEVKDGPAREPALDGLILLRDPRSREIFRALVDDPALPLDDPMRVKAAGGLHRLGDPHGLEFLLATFRGNRGPGRNEALRRQVLWHVVSNPGRESAEVLPEVLEDVRLGPTDRGLLVELITLSGMSEIDPSLVRLVGRPCSDHPRPERPDRRPPPGNDKP